MGWALGAHAGSHDLGVEQALLLQLVGGLLLLSSVTVLLVSSETRLLLGLRQGETSTDVGINDSCM
jgi:hypothetical protein